MIAGVEITPEDRLKRRDIVKTNKVAKVTSCGIMWEVRKYNLDGINATQLSPWFEGGQGEILKFRLKCEFNAKYVEVSIQIGNPQDKMDARLIKLYNYIDRKSQLNLNFTAQYSKSNDSIILWDNEKYLKEHDQITLVAYFQTIREPATLGGLQKNQSDYSFLLNNKDFSDIALIISGKRIFAHKVILAAQSLYFYEILNQNRNLTEIEIQDFDFEVMKVVLYFIYAKKIHHEIDVDGAINVIPASCKYGLLELTQLAINVVTQQMSIENVLKALTLSEICETDSLKQKCIMFIVRHSQEFTFDQLKSIGDASIYTELFMAMSKSIK